MNLFRITPTARMAFVCLVTATNLSGLPPLGYAGSFARSQRTAGRETRDFSVVLDGTIGKHPIEMSLTRQGSALSGSYFYESVGVDIDLDGKVDSANTVSARETDENGKTTGVFKGHLSSRDSGAARLVEFSGTWSKPDGSGAMPFSLIEQHFDVGPGARIVSKKIAEEHNKPKYSIDVDYPRVEGLATGAAAGFNREIESVISKEVSEFKKDAADSPDETSDMGSDLAISYEIMYANPGLISVAMAVENYSAGASHPNHFSRSVNYDLTSGKRLVLADLFKPGSGYLPVISRYCIARLKRRLGDDSDADWINKGAGPNAENYQSWNITGRSLVITFDPYQVAAYAAGEQTIRIPYTTLEDIVKPEGPLSPLLK